MADVQSPPSSTADREIVISRLFDAPPKLVFEAFTDPRHLVHWFGPNGFTITNHEIDVRPGGIWHLTMHGQDGVDYPNWITYVEVAPPERLVYDHGSERGSVDFRTTVTFDNEGGKTRLTMHSVFPTAAAREYVVREFDAVEGGNQTLDRLSAYLRTL